MCSTIKTAANTEGPIIPSTKEGTWTRPSNVTILRGLYVATTFLCAFMIFWILVFPSSWLVGRSDIHDDLIVQTMSEPNQVTSMELVTKYKGHSAVHFSHTLPGAIWAGAIPFQLHPRFRNQYPRVHRVVGRVFVAVSLLMMVGVGIILKRELLYEESFKDLPPNKLPATPGILFQSGWFLVTAIVATLQARAKKFRSHQRFVIRHVASGIWIALQRVLLLTVLNRPPFTREQQRAVFGDAAFAAIAICFVCGEIAIHLIEDEQKKKVKDSQ